MVNNREKEIDKLSRILWDYHHVNHDIISADLILIFTSLDLSVPKYAAELFLKGYSKSNLILIAGDNALSHKDNSQNNIQKTSWGMSEAQKFKEIVVSCGVPESKVITETRSTNSQMNVEYSEKIVKDKGLKADSIILIQKPTMERRAYATFKKFWTNPKVNLMVTSSPVSYDEYMKEFGDKEKMINIMVGDLQRIKLYPEKGFQIVQDIPSEVWEAYKKLVQLGYTKHLI